jgi:hypothetical protein
MFILVFQPNSESSLLVQALHIINDGSHNRDLDIWMEEQEQWP